MRQYELSHGDRQALAQCAKRLQLSPEETVRRAVSDLHHTLFQGEEGIVFGEQDPISQVAGAADSQGDRHTALQPVDVEEPVFAAFFKRLARECATGCAMLDPS